ncbi:MAG: YxcD family protein [Alicyclobacillus sp.]|nr:YxcD family protein [Alicyclobacillus sp.]
MQLHMSEQDVVDACAVYVARRCQADPRDVVVDLIYDRGFAAEARAGWQTVRLSEQEMVDAIAEFLEAYHNFDPYALDIQLQFPDENRIEAYVVVGALPG